MQHQRIVTSFASLLLALAACNDPTTPKPPKAWTCADLKAASTFSWSVDPVQDTLVTLTVSVKYPADACPTESAWFRWTNDHDLFPVKDAVAWERLSNGRLQASSSITHGEWAASRSLKTYIVWGLTPDYDADSTCAASAPAFDCGEYDTLTVSDVLP